MVPYNNICCFFGHRTISLSQKQQTQLYHTIKNLITEKGVTTFLFGSRSQFDDLCHETVTELKTEFQNIKRIYVRAQYRDISNEYHSYLLQSYEETYFPNRVINAGRASYIQRNFEMIDRSKFCIIYFNNNYKTKSGTKIAYDYAIKKGKLIINIFDS